MKRSKLKERIKQLVVWTLVLLMTVNTGISNLTVVNAADAIPEAGTEGNSGTGTEGVPAPAPVEVKEIKVNSTDITAYYQDNDYTLVLEGNTDPNLTWKIVNDANEELTIGNISVAKVDGSNTDAKLSIGSNTANSEFYVAAFDSSNKVVGETKEKITVKPDTALTSAAFTETNGEVINTIDGTLWINKESATITVSTFDKYDDGTGWKAIPTEGIALTAASNTLRFSNSTTTEIATATINLGGKKPTITVTDNSSPNGGANGYYGEQSYKVVVGDLNKVGTEEVYYQEVDENGDPKASASKIVVDLSQDVVFGNDGVNKTKIKFYFKDKLGNIVESEAYSINLDLVVPVVEVKINNTVGKNYVNANEYSTSTIDVDVSGYEGGSGIKSLTYKVGEGTSNDITLTENKASLKIEDIVTDDGAYTVTFTLTNNVDKTFDKTFDFTLDKTAPTISFIGD